VFDNNEATYVERYRLRATTEVLTQSEADPSQWTQLELLDARPVTTSDFVEKAKFSDGRFRHYTNHLLLATQEQGLGMPTQVVLSNEGVKVYSAENVMEYEYGLEHVPFIEGTSSGDFIDGNYNFESPTPEQVTKWQSYGWLITESNPSTISLKSDENLMTIDLPNHSIIVSLYESGKLIETMESFYLVSDGSALPIREVVTTFVTVSNGDCIREVTTMTYSDYEVIKAVDSRQGRISHSDFTLSPNPASERVHLNLTSISDEIKQIQVVDMIGKVNMQISTFATNEIDISQLKAGMYHLVIVTKSGFHTKTFTKL
jgi:Secretion system C-terminal sorting domain